MMKTVYLPCIILGLLLLTGCGDKVKLGGTVTYSDDGSPLGIGTVCFETDTSIAYGRLNPDGTYVVGSFSENDGLPQGNYRVFIMDATRETESGSSKIPTIEYLIDQKFTRGATSGLTLEVGSSTKKYDFSVDRFTSKK